MDKLIAMTKAAELLDLAPRSVRRLAHVGILDRRRRGRRAFITASSLARFLDARAIAPRLSAQEMAVRLLALEARVAVLEQGRRPRGSLPPRPLRAPRSLPPSTEAILGAGSDTPVDDYELITEGA